MQREPHRRTRVLLINPPALRHVQYGENNEIIRRYWRLSDSIAPQLGDQYDEPNLGILMLAAAVSQDAYPVEVLDLHVENQRSRRATGRHLTWRRIRQMLRPYVLKADVVGISVITISVPPAVRLTEIIRQTKPSIHILAGGVFPTLNPIPALLPGVDAVVVGEGEAPLLRYLDQFETARHIDAGIPGVIYNNSRQNPGTPSNRPEVGRAVGECRTTLTVPDHSAPSVTKPTLDLDRAPAPAWHMLYSPTRSEPRVFRILTAKGCGYQCTFCSPARALGNTLRPYPLALVEQQARTALDTFGSDKLVIGDLTFFHEFDHSAEVCQMLARLQLSYKFKYWCQTRFDRVTDESARLLRESGCTQVALGIEAPDQQLLNKMRKGASLTTLDEALSILRDHRLPVQAYLMVGLPTESREQILHTIDFACEQIAGGYVQVANPAIYVPFPGNADAQHVNIVDHSYQNYAMCVFPHQNPLPVYQTELLDRFEIRGLWEFGLASISKALPKASDANA